MIKDNSVYLKHMLDAISRIAEYTKGINLKRLAFVTINSAPLSP